MNESHKRNIELKKPDATWTLWFLLHKMQKEEKETHRVEERPVAGGWET